MSLVAWCMLLVITGTLHDRSEHIPGTACSYYFSSKVWSFSQWKKFCNILKYCPKSKTPFSNYSLLITFRAMTLLVLCVCVCVCVVTNSVRHTGHFRTKSLNGREMVGAGVKSGSWASADWLWAVASDSDIIWMKTLLNI